MDDDDEDYENYYSDPAPGITPGTVIIIVATIAFLIMGTILLLRG